MQFHSPLLNTYLEYVEDTESPRIFHIWSCLSCVAACMGRRIYLDFGIEPMYPNMFVLLVGPPAAKKSTAMKIATRLVKAATEVRFAPDDTAGQRQGLIAALEGNDKDVDEEEQFLATLGMAKGASLDSLSVAELGKIDVKSFGDHRDKNTLFAAASDVASFVGERSPNMITFLTRLYDGDDYLYQLKDIKKTVRGSLLNLLGCATPSTIADTLPAASIGQGFTSRLVFVYGDKKHKLVPRPAKLPEDLAIQIKNVFNHLYFKFEGRFQESDETQEYMLELYAEEPKIADPRFIYYTDRRQIHLLKLSMAVAASRLSNVIERQDLEDAIRILRATEINMPEALGEYGMSPLATAKQKMLEFLRSVKGPVGIDTLSAVMNRDMRHSDFIPSVNELINAGKIMEIKVPGQLGRYVVAVDKKTVDTLEDFDAYGLMEAEGD